MGATLPSTRNTAASANNDAGVVAGKTYQTSSTSSVLTPYNEVRLLERVMTA